MRLETSTLRSSKEPLVHYNALFQLFFRLGPISGCIPQSVPKSKPTVGMWDWLKTAVYEGPTVLAGAKLEVWASNISVSTRKIKIYQPSCII